MDDDDDEDVVPMSAETAAYRDFLAEKEHTASQDFDRTLTTLASGALAISLVFVHDVAPHPTDIGWLVGSWSCFAASLLAILGSYLSSMKAIRARITEIDKGGDGSTRPLSSRITVALNWTSAALLGLGVASLVVFAGLNVRQESDGGSKAKPTTVTSTTRAGQEGVRRTTTTPASTAAP